MRGPAREIAERRVAEHFLSQRATAPERAVAYWPDRWARMRALARLRDLGIVRGPGEALWIDETAWHDRRDTHRKRALALLALGVVSAAIAGVTTLRS